jgi:hypothetical protein
MAVTTFDTNPDASTPEQQAAEARALEQGEKIAQMQQEDQQRAWDQNAATNEDATLIGGKFKSQDDLLKAYEELQKKLGQDTPEPDEEPTEEQPEVSEEVPEEEAPEEVAESEAVLTRAADEYAQGGELTEESIEALSQMDSKDLIKAYVDFYSKNAQKYEQAKDLQATEQRAIMNIAGGEDAYGEMMQWASQNLDPQEIDSYNSVTNSGNVSAIKFAVEALKSRYVADVGQERELVTGRKAPSKSKVFRSNAELARAIADPRYQSDPAYRMDVEQKLANSPDLL